MHCCQAIVLTHPWIQYNKNMLYHEANCSLFIHYVIHCFILSWKPRNDKGPAHLRAPLSCVPTWSVLSVQCPCPPHIDWLPGPEPGLANHRKLSELARSSCWRDSWSPQLPGLGSDLQNRVILRLRRPRPAPAPSHARPQPGHQRSQGRCQNQRG